MHNQVPPPGDYNALTLNVPLCEAVERAGAGWAMDRMAALGAIVGSREARHHAVRTDSHPPVLHRYDAAGERINQIERDPSWHWLVDRTLDFDLHGLTVRHGLSNTHAARAAMILLWGEVSLPTICPVSANYAMVPALSVEPAIQRQWLEALTTTDRGKLAFAGASMTERQGGSDIRQTATVATPQADGSYVLDGDKWFVTCPWADLFLVLARAPGGLTCFLADARQGGFFTERLKDKLGWHGLGVGEVQLRGVAAQRVGEEGRGVGAIMRMITYTRLDVLLENCASIRTGTLRAIHYARHRTTFGRRLVDQPLMTNVLTDLALESEAATAAGMRVAQSYDVPDSQYGRIALTLMKYWVSKRAAPHAAEALECLGGNGYVEASGMPRLLRDSVVGSVWEGSGNIAALDVLRAIRSGGSAFDAFRDECCKARGGNRSLDSELDDVFDDAVAWAASEDAEWTARLMVERLALVLQASLLMQTAPNAVADAFCHARLANRGATYGRVPLSSFATESRDRALPA